MRRLIAILMLTLLPLHLGWAAMSAYCQHESGAAARHLGHHFHAHHSEGEAQQAQGKAGVQADADCGVCHLSTAQMPAAALSMAAPLPVASSLAPLASKAFRSFYPPGLDRPNWRRPL